VSAHKVNIFAYVEGDTVYTESYFSDGTKVKGGIIEVYDSQGKKLLEGKTDKEGYFSFKPPKKDDLKVVLNASLGHRSSCLLSADELPDLKPKEPQKGKVTQAQIDLDQFVRIIDTSLDKKLSLIIRELKRQENRVFFREIISGIGYILGIFGIIMYFLSKKRN
jgi:nickel transport protein